MAEDNQPEQSGLTDAFQAAHSALAIGGSFANQKIAIGEILILENSRIEPSEEDKEKRFGHSPEQFEAMPEAVRDAIKEKFIDEQMERINDARNRTIVTYENYLADAEHALIEVRDVAIASLAFEVTFLKDPVIMTGTDNFGTEKSDIYDLEGSYRKIKSGASAEVALDKSYEDYLTTIRGFEDDYYRRMVTEYEQHRATMQHHLHPDKTPTTLDNVEEGALLVSSTFPLHALSSFYERKTGKPLVFGTITDEGSMESHGAILIAAMGIPYARIAADDMARMKNGDKAIMDGANGQVLLHPNKTVIEQYEKLVDEQAEQSEALLHKSSKRKSVQTSDGVKINVHANFAASHETYGLREANPVEVGLYRTEITASMRENKVTADMWQAIIGHNMREADASGKGYIGTTVRTLDFAGDKSDLPKQEREELQAEMTKVQMRGLLLLQQKMAEQGQKSKLKIMVPMISSNEDMKAMQGVMNEQAEELGVKTIKLGCMIEVPALITEMDKLDTAFMSVGSNDLIHSILGIDRYDSESIKKYDPTNPAVLKALDQVHFVGHERSIPFSICGDMASHPEYTALLIGAGFTNMSAGIDSIPAVKEMASRVNMEEARNLFRAVRETDTRAGREAILRDFNERLGLSADGRIDSSWKPPEEEWVASSDLE